MYEVNQVKQLNKIRYNRPNFNEPSDVPKKPYLKPSII